MSDVLNRIENTLANLCPCGAEPREGSAYCGDDCTPTHRAGDTISDIDGTPMRWRPDLVTATDDSDLTEVDTPRSGYTGRFNARVFRRESRPWVLHLRLDDGHRFAGLDVEVGTDPVIGPDVVEAVIEGWRRIERELGDRRHTMPDGEPPPRGDPWWDVARRWAEQEIARRGTPGPVCAWLRSSLFEELRRGRAHHVVEARRLLEEMRRDNVDAGTERYQ